MLRLTIARPRTPGLRGMLVDLIGGDESRPASGEPLSVRTRWEELNANDV